MKIFCVGRNYAEHAKELGNAVPEAPVIFMKPDTALLAPVAKFEYPSFTSDLHYEIELVLRIGKTAKNIPAANALSCVDAITVGVDFTARDVQAGLKSKGLPWEKAKAFDHSAVIGNFLPKNDFASLENLNFELIKNKQIVQQGNTSLMLWKIDELIAYVSQYFTLKKGDIIFTGTPKGVAKIKENDVLEGFLEGKQMFKIQVK